LNQSRFYYIYTSNFRKQMKQLLPNIRIHINDRMYLKDPESSDLGRSIIREGIYMIDEIGFDSFTFKKLAQKLQTTESSVYRYFENKHKLLLYITSWYWAWLDMQIVLQTANIASAEFRLKVIIDVLGCYDWSEYREQFPELNSLGNILVSESTKAFLTKEVGEENKQGLFAGFKQLCSRVKSVLLEINDCFPYPSTLSSTLVEGVFHQGFYARHFPTLTEMSDGKSGINEYYYHMAISALKNNCHV
jgi:AcrR family transcriptional regulator